MRIKLFNILIVWGLLYGFGMASQPVKITFNASPVTKKVYIVGDFNNWSKTTNPLVDKNGDGTWETTLYLEEGRYEYRFFLDDMIWIKDPNNPEWGGENSNSILWVRTATQPGLSSLEPENGTTVKNPVVEISAKYEDGIGLHGIDLEKTVASLNGQSIKMAFNSKLNKIEAFPGKLKDGEYLLEIQACDKVGNQTQLLRSFFVVNAVNVAPVVDAGNTKIEALNSTVQLNSGIYYDPDKDNIEKYRWNLISKPEKSKAKLSDKDVAFPSFKPDKEGRYVFSLHISDGELESNVDSVDVYAFRQKEYPVEFRISDSSFAKKFESSIATASVAGEFNRWSESANIMTDYNHDGNWSTWINLDPGEYEYKFVINGKYWIPDPANPRNISDGWQGFNSIISSSLDLVPVAVVNPVFAPGKIVLDASASYSKIREKLTFHWIQDINNPQRYSLESQDKITIPTPRKSGKYYFYLIVKDQFGNFKKKNIVLVVKNGNVTIQDFSDSPDWARDAIVYEIFIRKFTDAGNFQGLIEKIPYLKTLGINCIWLMPVYESPTSHGYGPSHFFNIESDYGTMDDFKKFVNIAHEAGIRVILDFVANHTSDQHPYFYSAFHNRFSTFRNWYCWHTTNEKSNYYTYEFYNDWDTLPNLNYENPNVRRYILETATYWINLGVDGFRCDVAWGVPHDFWKTFRRIAKNINPEFLLLDEVLPRSPVYHKDEFDISYDTDFYGNLLDVMNKRKPLSAIEYGLQKTRKNYPEYTLDFRYIENHDMDRFISQYDVDKTKLAAALLLTIPGTPLIYYGQEIGLKGKDDLMPWSNNENPLFDYYRKLIHLRRQNVCLRRGTMAKVATNTEGEVYAYLRFDSNGKYLIVLNFGEKNNACQLLFPENIVNIPVGGKLIMENALTSEKVLAEILRERQIQIDLKEQTAYIFKIIN